MKQKEEDKPTPKEETREQKEEKAGEQKEEDEPTAKQEAEEQKGEDKRTPKEEAREQKEEAPGLRLPGEGRATPAAAPEQRQDAPRRVDPDPSWKELIEKQMELTGHVDSHATESKEFFEKQSEHARSLANGRTF